MSQDMTIAAAELIALGGKIRDAAATTETRFVAVGETLERSTGILGQLNATFAGLAAELNSDDLRLAGERLGAAGGMVARLGTAQREQGTALARLVQILGTIEHDTTAMDKAIGAASGLSINVRIEALALGGQAEDFLAFAADIDRSLKQAKQNLLHFRHALIEVARQVRAAQAGEQAIARRHAAAIQAIPRRLAAGMSMITTRCEQASAAAQAVGTHAEQIKAGIGQAVLALQIGDTTRQRAEHVYHALDLLLRRIEAGSRTSVATCCALQSAQLTDTADELGREVRDVRTALERLSGEACRIVRLGQTAYGAGGARQVSFVSELEDDIDQARVLLEDYRTARATADQALAAASAAAAQLQQHIAIIRSMETDLRIMGLNTTLKCGRIGARARSLAAVAQELRTCAGAMATQADAVMTGMSQLAATADALNRDAGAGDDTGAVAGVLAESVSRLATAGHGLDGALRTLEQDAGAVVGLLHDTVAGITMHDEIGAMMRQAADRLRDWSKLPCPVADESDQALFSELAGRYTMARERDIHRRITGLEAGGGDAAGDTDSMLF